MISATVKPEEKLEPFTPAVPITYILANLFNKFMKYWTNSEVEYLGVLKDKPLEMPVEISIPWNGNTHGTLTIRCQEGFIQWLSKCKSDESANALTENEIFNKTVRHFCAYVIHTFWKSEHLRIGPLLPISSRPEVWPSDSPDAAFSVRVEQHPVEIRLWMPD
jgi:hypothetical protein